MAIRITTIAEPNRTTVKVDGRLQREDFDELVRMVDGISGPTALDFTELQSIDRAATALLRDLIDLGVELLAATPYVRLLLESETERRRPNKEDVN